MRSEARAAQAPACRVGSSAQTAASGRRLETHPHFGHFRAAPGVAPTVMVGTGSAPLGVVEGSYVDRARVQPRAAGVKLRRIPRKAIQRPDSLRRPGVWKASRAFARMASACVVSECSAAQTNNLMRKHGLLGARHSLPLSKWVSAPLINQVLAGYPRYLHGTRGVLTACAPSRRAEACRRR